MMTTKHKTASRHVAEDSISFADLPEALVAIRITGRGSFHNSVELKRLADAMTARPGQKTRFIIDLNECSTMDSTFMGVLASMAIHQLKETGEKMAAVNVNAQNQRLLETLGLTQFMNVRSQRNGGVTMAGGVSLDDSAFQCPIKEPVERIDRIIHMIEAHKQLCEADPENNMRFESVLKYLHESLDRENRQ